MHVLKITAAYQLKIMCYVLLHAYKILQMRDYPTKTLGIWVGTDTSAQEGGIQFISDCLYHENCGYSHNDYSGGKYLFLTGLLYMLHCFAHFCLCFWYVFWKSQKTYSFVLPHLPFLLHAPTHRTASNYMCPPFIDRIISYSSC